MQEALDAVSERYCKGHHYENVALTDEMVRRICEVKSLVNMGFIATAITDAALQHLATLPKLAYLFLQDSDKISGEGFRHFRNHAKLEHIGIENVSITDEGLKAIVQIPKLKSLRLVNSRVSFAGLLAAADTKIQFYLSGGRFSKEQIAEFEQVQRDAAKSKKKLDPDDLAAARGALLAFFAAMSEWEKFATSRIDDADDGEVQHRCDELFARYCTPVRRSGFRPEGISFSTMEGGTYGGYELTDAECKSKNKIYIYAKDEHGFARRFLLVRKDGRWLVDRCQGMDGKNRGL